MKRMTLVSLLFLLTACGQVDPGERAVFAYFGKVDQTCYTEGLYWYNPLTSDMYEIDAKVQRHEVRTGGASRDLQDVQMTLVVNYAISPNKCHVIIQNVGRDFVHRVVTPAIEEVAKASSALFPVEKIIQDRPKLKATILEGLRVRLSQYEIDVHDVALTNIEFSKEFSAAIEQKQIQEQNVQRAEFMRQQAVKEAERTVALARGQADANRLVRESLTKDLLTFKALEKWNGELPRVTGAAVPFIAIDEKGK